MGLMTNTLPMDPGTVRRTVMQATHELRVDILIPVFVAWVKTKYDVASVTFAPWHMWVGNFVHGITILPGTTSLARLPWQAWLPTMEILTVGLSMG
jgi:hypothetical protein